MLASNPLELDRALERFARLSARFRLALRQSDAVEHAFELLPRELEEEPLAELLEQSQRDPLAAPLRQWASALLVRHDCLETERRVAHALYRDTRPFERPLRGEFSPAALLRNALRDAAQRSSWLEALESHTGRLEAARFAHWEAREQAEQRRRAPAFSSEDAASIRDAAAQFLARSRDAFASLELGSLARLLEVGLGRNDVAHYPTRLTPRSVAELVGEGAWLKGYNPQFGELPELLGAASVLRALSHFGAALHEAAADGRRPFVVHRDPGKRRALEFAALFALLPSLRAFAERNLSVSRARLGDHERVLAQVLLLGARVAALCVLLSDFEGRGARAYRDAFLELAEQALGFELPASFACALFVRPRARAEFLGLLAALDRNQRLIEHHDEDWFRNPRAVGQLRAELDSPPTFELDVPALRRGTDALLGWLGEKL